MCLLASLNSRILKRLTYVFDDTIEDRVQARLLNLKPIIEGSGMACLDHLSMDRACFSKLCEMLRDVGRLEGNSNASLEEMVALFLFTISHDTKNKRTQLYFRRSAEAISRHFNLVLRAILRCHHLLLKKPPPVAENCQDDRWKWFKNHKDAAGLRHRPFPLFDELGKVFGKDRAAGNEGESVQDAVEEMEGEEINYQEEEQVPVNREGMSSAAPNQFEPTTSATPTSSKTKNARTETIETFRDFSTKLEKMSNVMEAAGEHIGRLADCFKRESESAERRMQVTSEVMKIQGLTLSEVLSASKQIATNPLEVDFFFSLPDDFKYTYIQGLLIPDQSNH